jgi:uncharacterized membrane protein
MVTTAALRPAVSDERILHGVLALIGLARVVGALLRAEAWGAGPTLGLLLAVLAGRELFRRAGR